MFSPEPHSSDDRMHLATLEELGQTLVGPLLASFADYHLAKMQAAQVQTILYIAREGRLMMEVADLTCPAAEHGIRRVYAKLSRRIAWGTLLETPEQAFDSHVGRSRLKTVRALFDTVPFQSEFKAALLSQAGLTLDAALTPPHLERLRQAGRSLQDQGLADIQGQRERLARYARQLGVSDAPLGLVDTGWSCTIQDALSQALAGESKSGRELATQGCYLGVHAKARRSILTAKDGYIHDPAGGGPILPLLEAGGALRALETLLSCGERSAWELFEAPDGRVEVELAPYGPSARLIRYRQAIREGALRAAQELATQKHASAADRRQEAHRRLERFLTQPTPREARAVLAMGYVQDVGVGAEEPIGWTGVTGGTAWVPALVAGAPPLQRGVSSLLSAVLRRKKLQGFGS